MKTAFKAKITAGVTTLLVIGGIAVAAAPSAHAAVPLPAYPATTTLNLNSQNCVTDDVIMNDPTSSPIQDTYGSDGNPVVTSQATPPVDYKLWYLNSSNKWVPGPPPGVQINPGTGLISSYGPGALAIPGDIQGTFPSSSDVTYTVRDHGEDSLGAEGTEQFQVNVNDNGTTVSITYEGNDFDNANGALTIQLNASSTDSTALTLAAVPSSLGIPGSTPVTFSLAPGSVHWNITNNVLTGVSASDPEIIARTADNDVVFFTLSGISTDSGGVFFTNTDVNPCVNPAADIVNVNDPGNQVTTVNSAVSLGVTASTPNGDPVTSYSANGLPSGLSINSGTGVISGTPTVAGTSTVTVTASDSDESGSATFTWAVNPVGSPPPAGNTADCSTGYGNEVNPFGNGFDAFRQGAFANNEIVGWPATQADPATHFLCAHEGGNIRLEYAPHGNGTGLCVSNPGNDELVLRWCNAGIWQQFTPSGRFLLSAVNGQFVVPGGTGVQLSTSSAHPSWGGDKYSWTSFSSLP